MTAMRSASALPLAGWLVLAGCSGSIEGGDHDLGPPGSQTGATAAEPGASTPAATGTGSSDPAARPPTPMVGFPAPAFTVIRETLRLLPFDTRLNRLAVVLGVPGSDRLFDGLRTRRLELGDQDYGKAVTPDPSWSPNRMALWMKTIRPICQSAVLNGKYPSLRADPAPLIAAAWGRPADAADLDSIRAGLASVADDRRGELSCLAILSAVEFVAR